MVKNLPVMQDAKDTGLIPGSGRSPGEGNGSPLQYSCLENLMDSEGLFILGFPGDSAGKESTCNVEALGLIPGLGRSLGEGNGYPLQYSGLRILGVTNLLLLLFPSWHPYVCFLYLNSLHTCFFKLQRPDRDSLFTYFSEY